MKRFYLFFCLIMILCSSQAEDLILKSGKIYKNFQIYKVDTSGLAITHEYGGATIPFPDLPDSLRKKYSEQEKKFEAKKKARAERRKQKEAEALKIKKSLPKTETTGITEEKHSLPEEESAPKPSEKQTTSTKSSETYEYTGSKKIYIGPRGGRYYVNKNGNKTYIRRKK